MTGVSRPASTVDLPRILGDIHPRPRWTELRLLVIAAVALIVGSISLSAGVTGRLAIYAPVEGVMPLGFGDVIQVGQVRLRLERPRAARSGR